MSAKPATAHKLFVNEDRTVLVRVWEITGAVEVALRDRSYDTWGPPIMLSEEKTG